MDFLKSELIIVYDKENDEFYFTTLKIGQTYLKGLYEYTTHIEIQYPLTHGNKERGWERDDHWFYTFDEKNISFNDFLKISNKKDFEDILSSKCTIVTRNPKERFDSGFSQALFEEILYRSNIFNSVDHDVINEWMLTDDGLNYMIKFLEGDTSVKLLLENSHLKPINEVYLSIAKPHHKIIDISELGNVHRFIVNEKKSFYTQYLPKLTKYKDNVYSKWLDIYGKKDIESYNEIRQRE